MGKDLLIEGDIFEIKKGDHIGVKNFPKHFLFSNHKFDFSLYNGEMTIGEYTEGLDTSIFIGKYLVTKTQMAGGGRDKFDVIPDAPKVTARMIYDGKITPFEIYFYQSGGFSISVENREKVGEASIKWTL